MGRPVTTITRRPAMPRYRPSLWRPTPLSRPPTWSDCHPGKRRSFTGISTPLTSCSTNPGEIPYQALTNLPPHRAVNIGLACPVSQGPSRWVSASVYPPGGDYTAWPAEWWGLYASTVGPDTVLSSNAVVKSYGVPSGVALGNFLEHISFGPLSPPPVFMANPLILPLAATYDPYTGPSVADYVLDADSSSTLTFGKISGPDWLRVAADGTLA